jgi:hypothetical protein
MKMNQEITISVTSEDFKKAIQDKFTDPATNVNIRKAKIIDGLFLEVEFVESTSSGSNKVKKTCTALIHQDLQNAFDLLDAHLAKVCEQFNSDGEVADLEITCHGFALASKDEGVVLLGSRAVDEGIVNLVSPLVKWSSDYQGISMLSLLVQDCINESKLYLFTDKHKPSEQLSMFAEEQDDDANDKTLGE